MLQNHTAPFLYNFENCILDLQSILNFMKLGMLLPEYTHTAGTRRGSVLVLKFFKHTYKHTTNVDI